MTKPTKAEMKKMTKAEVVEWVDLLEDMTAEVTEFPEPANVWEAMSHLMARVGYVQKEASGSLPYTFASEPAFIRAVRPHMVDLGLIVTCTHIKHLETEIYKSKSGAMAFNRVFLYRWKWTHSPSLTEMETWSIGEGTDYGDKSCNKSMTVGLKYNYRQSLNLETGDDPDYTPSKDFERAQARKAEETGRQVPAGDGARVDNQWEIDVLDEVMATEYIQGMEVARPHLVNILNNSIFRTTVPYGELTREFCLAYYLAWQAAKEKYPDDDTPARAQRVNANWEKIMEEFVEEAIEIFGDAQPELLDAGLGYN